MWEIPSDGAISLSIPWWVALIAAQDVKIAMPNDSLPGWRKILLRRKNMLEWWMKMESGLEPFGITSFGMKNYQKHQRKYF